MNKVAYSIAGQISLLKQRGMFFKNEKQVGEQLKNISYYRLKGYWWDMQNDPVQHTFPPGIYFEDIIERYDFDRQLRIILFDAIEQIEIALRTKMIYHLSLAYNGLWYLRPALFDTTNITLNGLKQTAHLHVLNELQKEFGRSQEIFAKDHRYRYPHENADAWKMLEVASLGTLSKLYKNLKNKLPEKAVIANEMGLNSTFAFVSWLEAIALIRNIIAHHSRLWSRPIIKKPSMWLNNPEGRWFIQPLKSGQLSKPFAVISCMVYLCNHLSHSEDIRQRIIALINAYPNLPIYKYGFFNDWQAEPLWDGPTKY
jgi:abortive infection bacteriophage resistance protein